MDGAGVHGFSGSAADLVFPRSSIRLCALSHELQLAKQPQT